MALFGGNKPDHPMAALKQAKQLLAELPANDPLKAVNEASFWLDSIIRTEEFPVDDRYELFDLIDHAAKIPHRKISQEYLVTDRQGKFREQQLWNAAFEYVHLLGNAYNQCIKQFQAGAAGSGGIKRHLPIVTARLLRALTTQLKWMLLHYGPIQVRLWGELGRAYHFAEQKGVSRSATEIYPGVSSGYTTIEQEFVRAMVLGVSSTDGLTPLKQEIAERLITHLASSFTVQFKPVGNCCYFFDLSGLKAPGRVMNDLEITETMRFVSPVNALPVLNNLLTEIKVKEEVPAHINLGATFDSALVVSVIEHLKVYWADRPPARRSERRRTATRLTVMHGFRSIVNRLEGHTDDTSLDFQGEDGVESWIVENVSESGFGAIIPQVKGDWIKLGSLLALQPETAPHWGIGVIRRISSDEFQQRRVGIELLSRAGIPVTVTAAANFGTFNATRDGDAGMLLSTSPDKNGEVAILLRTGSFTEDLPLDMTLANKHYQLMPSALVEGGEDYDWGRFKISRAP